MKRKALGKGLSALLPEPEPLAGSDTAADVPVELLDPNPFQPRTRIRQDKLDELNPRWEKAMSELEAAKAALAADED